MELQEIITFVSVVQHESFSKGAKSLGYSQAAVTIHIKKPPLPTNLLGMGG